MAESGVGSDPPITIHELLLQAVANYGDYQALAFKKRGQWHKLTYKEYYEQCRTVAKGFIKVRGLISGVGSGIFA